MVAVTLVLATLNLLLIVCVHARRIRQGRTWGPGTAFPGAAPGRSWQGSNIRRGFRDRLWLRWQLDGFDELERPLAAVALVERLRPAVGGGTRAAPGGAARGRCSRVARPSRQGAGSRGGAPSRSGHSGWIAAEETVPLLIKRAP